MSRETKYFPFGGGLDLVTPAIAKVGGHVIAAENYEPRPEGYRRTDGFERYDGHTQPSEATYYVLNFDAGTAAIAEGDTVTGATSSATGVALIAGVLESGSYAGSDGAGYLVLSEVSGTFQDNEDLQVSASTKCVADGAATEKGADNDTDNDTWLQDAIETARAAISTVPGVGDILGVWRYNSKNYAFRNATGGATAKMYVSSTSGWTECDLGNRIEFTSGGTTEIAEADTITGATSGATAVVKRIQLTSGTWAGGDAAGWMILYTQVGTFQAENLNVGASTNLATIAGDSTANTLQPSGRFEFITNNFYGSATTKRMYGVDGVSKGFEWDGSVFVPIHTGMATDTPTHVAAHRNHLFFSFDNGSVQHSGIGTPYVWTILSGAAEFGFGQEVTGLLSGVGGVMLIYGANKTSVLYGNDTSDWSLQTPLEENGAVEWTIQRPGKPVAFDGQGVTDMQTTQAYGDFRLGGLSANVYPWFRTKKKSNAYVTASMRVRDKNQYRLFWSDGSILAMDLNGKYPQYMPLNYGLTVKCASSVKDADGTEWLLFGSTDGYVYRADKGTSFDGSEVQAFIRLPYNHLGSPTRNKRFLQAILELESAPGISIQIAPDFDYGDADQPTATDEDFDVAGGGGFWDEAIWNQFYWSAQVVGRASADINGIGANASLVISSAGTYEEPHTLNGITLHFSYRGLKK